jgi:uncharacterized membrane protein YqgA involved in biofilm formation
MPYGVIINSLCVLLGGFSGFLLKNKLPGRLRSSLPVLFGTISIVIGAISIQKVNCMSVIVLAIIMGYILGTILKFEDIITRIISKVCNKLIKDKRDNDSLTPYLDILIGIVPLFCASGTGIYGAMHSSFTGDHSILFVKSILDFFTSMIFGALLGIIVSLIAIPQFFILLAIFLLSNILLPYITPEMLMDFTACGGIIMIATGLRIGQIKIVSTVNLLPAFLLVMPLSFLYSRFLG